MAGDSLWEHVEKPISVWNQPLEIDFKTFFKSISKFVIKGAAGNWGDATLAAVDAFASAGIKPDPGQLAWLLIRRALTRATYDLVAENANFLAANAPDDADAFCETLDLSLEEATMQIDRDFFDHPASLQILDLYQVPFKHWLMGHGLLEAQANTVIGRLPSYFVFALNHEWRRKPEVYQPILDAVETPFTQAGEREQGWLYYAAWLQKQIGESVFNETFSLSQIYVPLRAYYIEKIDDNEITDTTLSSMEKSRRIVVDLQTELDNWVDRADQRDAIRVVSGGPGSGKSSFARMYAANRAATYPHHRVLFIPLHQFDPKSDLRSGIQDFIQYGRLLTHNPLDPDSMERLIIIFDGLDELAMQGKIGTETARDFIEEVERTVRNYNTQQLRLQILLTGREVVVQANASKFRKDEQVLYVLPYFVSEREHEPQYGSSKYEDSQSLLEADQRQLWWQRYGTATGRGYEEMPVELQRRDLDDITTQPLLNYLVALSYTHGELNFSEQVNLNEIYADLLKAVYERDYAGGIHRVVQDMPLSNFIRILEEIGLATWHGDGRTTTISELQARCKSAGLVRLLEDFEEGAAAGVARLFTAFYFRQHEAHREGERTFEFTHKSFGEYLTARRVVRAISRMHSELTRRQENMETGWDEQEALRHWIEVYGDAPAMTQDLFRFVQSEVQLGNIKIVTEWQNMLGNLISWLLQYGLPMELLNPRPSYYKETQVALHAEETLLAIMYACANSTRQISRVKWFQVSPTAAGVWLSRLQGQRSNPINGLALECLGFLNLGGCRLHGRDLNNANLQYSNLEGVWLSLAILPNANFLGAKLEHANFTRSVLFHARFKGASLIRVGFVDANLEGADLREANLKEANLEGANLKEANLEGANLEGANLEGANLKGANLKGANLPNGKTWTPVADMARFTDPDHLDFWQPRER